MMNKKTGNRGLSPISKALQHRLPHLARLETLGGVAWLFTEKIHTAYSQFNRLENELAKQIRTTLC